MPTIKDVAKEAGVSTATVSYALNGHTKMVSEKTRRSVLAVAERLGYRADVGARNLKTRRTGLLGYAWHTNPTDEPHWILQQFIYYLAQAAEQQNYHLLTFTHSENSSIGIYEELIQSGRVDGFIVAETGMNDPRIRFLLDKSFPFVAFGRSNPEWSFSWVDTDGVAGARLATEHLITQGHRRIAFWGWSGGSLAGAYREQGYLQALATARISRDDTLMIYQKLTDFTEAFIHNVFDNWRKTENDFPTAIVTVSDDIAIRVSNVALQRGMMIGEDLSIIGFDDVPVLRYITPGITSVRQPLELISKTIITMLNQQIKYPGRNTMIQTSLIKPELVVRASTVRKRRSESS